MRSFYSEALNLAKEDEGMLNGVSKICLKHGYAIKSTFKETMATTYNNCFEEKDFDNAKQTAKVPSSLRYWSVSSTYASALGDKRLCGAVHKGRDRGRRQRRTGRKFANARHERRFLQCRMGAQVLGPSHVRGDFLRIAGSREMGKTTTVVVVSTDLRFGFSLFENGFLSTFF